MWNHSLLLYYCRQITLQTREESAPTLSWSNSVTTFCMAASCMQQGGRSQWRPTLTAGQGGGAPGVGSEHRYEGREGPGCQDLRAHVLPGRREVEEGRRRRVLPVRLRLGEQLDERPQRTGLHYLRLRASSASASAQLQKAR